MKHFYLFALIFVASIANAVAQPCITTEPYIIGRSAAEWYNLCGGKTLNFEASEVEGATGYKWTVPAGFTILSGQGTRYVSVKTAAIFTEANVSVQSVYPCGNSLPTSRTVYGIPRNYNDDLQGPREVLRGSINQYTVPNEPGLTYKWVADGCSVVGGQGTNSASIKVGPSVQYGTVRLTITNNCGAGVLTTRDFRIVPALNCNSIQPNYQVTNPQPCIGSTTGAVALTVTGGNPPYTYNWTGPDGFAASTEDISGLKKGSYYLKITDALGCVREENVYVGPLYEETMPPYPISGPADNLCGGKTVSYTATEAPGATGYNWTLPAGFTLISGQGTKTVTIKTPQSFESAQLMVAAVYPCGNGVSVYRELLGTPPNLEGQIIGPDQVLVGSTNVYTLPALPGVNYTWVADGCSVVGGQGTNSATIKAGSINGYVKVTIKNGCGTAPLATKFFTIRTGDFCSAPDLNRGITHPEDCVGSRTGAITLRTSGGTGPFTYSWTGPDGFKAQVPSISGLLAGLYHIKVTAPGGCYVEDYYQVGPPRYWPAPVSGPTTNLCGGKTVTFTASRVEWASSYDWTIPAGFTLISGQGTQTITLKTPANFTSAQLKVRGVGDCGSSAQAVVDLKGTPGDQSADISGPSRVVTGTTNMYTLPATPGFYYKWVADGCSVVGGQGTNTASIRAGAINGYVKLTISNACGAGPVSTKWFTVAKPSNAMLMDDGSEKATTGFQIYPNPVRNQATVVFDADNADLQYQMKVTDIFGQVLSTKKGLAVKGQNTVKVDVGGFAKGIYIVTIQTGKKVRSVKLMKDN